MSALQANPFLMAGGGDSGYEIERSLRFNSGDSAYLNRTPSSAGNRKTWTWSGWVKRSSLTTVDDFFSCGVNIHDGGAGGTHANAYFYVDGTLQVYEYSGGYAYNIRTTPTFNDPSAWYHIVISFDTTNSTSTDRLRIYVNGERITSFINNTFPSLNFEGPVNNNVAHYISDTAGLFNGYLADIHFIDGQALAPTDFGETDEFGVWQPIAYAGTYGTNGFHLDFSDNSSNAALGTDTSGNSNTWTVNNLSVAAGAGNDSLRDSPSQIADQTDTGAGGEVVGNYATLNPLHSATTLSNGNLDSAGGSGWSGTAATFGMSSGKWYFEYDNVVSNEHVIGIVPSTTYTLNTVTSYAYGSETGGKYSPPSSSNESYGDSWGAGDVIGVAFDADAGNLYFYKNGTVQNSGTAAFTGLTSGPYLPSVVQNGSSRSASLNFGQRAFAHTAPSGYKSLNTANLPEPTIADGSQYFDTKLWSGDDSSTRDITGLNMSPDLVWTKTRNQSYWHNLYDSVRGARKPLHSNTTNGDDTNNDGLYGGVSSFNSDGFSLAAGTTNAIWANDSSYTYVAWAWDAGSSTVSNTDGSITSNVRAQPSAGFSIVSYSGSSSAVTVGHGLNAAPEMIIIKDRDSGVYNWQVAHIGIGADDSLLLNSTAAKADYNAWNNTRPTSTVFSLGAGTLGVNTNGNNMIAYCFAPVEGYSAMGSYQGNGNASGPFVFTGFRPRWILVKASSSVTYGNWVLHDTARSVYNVSAANLYTNLSNSEDSTYSFDLLSNGFKIRSNAYDATNGNNKTYIYAAFAEHPFKTARAR